MKKILFSVLMIICTMIFSAAYATDAGKSGATGAPGEVNCTQCHADFPINSGGGSVSVTSNIPGWTYTPGQTYTINVTVSQTGQTLFGWGLVALKQTEAAVAKCLLPMLQNQKFCTKQFPEKQELTLYSNLMAVLQATLLLYHLTGLLQLQIQVM